MPEKTSARLAGRDRDGNPILDIILSIPDGLTGDLSCTERQLEAAKEFYCTDFQDGLTYSQAHYLLSYREHAKACASYFLRGAHPKVILLYARAIAAFISSEPDIAAYAASRSDRRFRAGTEIIRINRTKYFSEILAFFESLFREINPGGDLDTRI